MNEYLHKAWPEIYQLWKQGLSVIPIAFQDKKPLVKWETYQSQRPSYDQLEEWFTNDAPNVAIITGRISGLAVLDVDGDQGATSLVAAGLGRLPETPRVKTGGVTTTTSKLLRKASGAR